METSAGCCHIAPSACITGPHLLNIATPHSFTPPALHVSTPPHTHTHTYLHTLHPHFTSCYSCSSLFPHLCSLFLPHHPFHFCLPSFFLLVCVTVSFVSFSLIAPPSRTPLLPLFSSCSGWIETLCLLQGMLFSLIGQPTGRNLRQR